MKGRVLHSRLVYPYRSLSLLPLNPKKAEPQQPSKQKSFITLALSQDLLMTFVFWSTDSRARSPRMSLYGNSVVTLPALATFLNKPVRRFVGFGGAASASSNKNPNASLQ